MKKGLMAALGSGAGLLFGAVGTGIVMQKELDRMSTMAKKNYVIIRLFDQWMKVKQGGESIADYLKEKGYRTVAIYGMSFAGERLYDDLKDTEIAVRYGIDQNADKIYAEVDVLGADEDLPEVDAVIVTAVYYFDEIEEKLSNRMDCPILSLEDILYEI